MAKIYSFAPVVGKNPRILILGSMPGKASLEANQYYAHPHNQFWKMMGVLVDAMPDLAYEKRLEKLKDARIALWDVLQSCHRKTSLDSDIQNELPSDFVEFFSRYPTIDYIFFNGRKAYESFRRYVIPALPTGQRQMFILPSTSPAHAGMRFEDKLKIWQQIKGVK